MSGAVDAAALTVRTALPKIGRLTYSGSMNSPDDSALMLEYARSGDLSAFETLYRRHKDPLFRYLLRHSGKSEIAEDVFQEAWGKIIRSRERYRPSARFSTFLFRVAHNCLMDYFRSNKRHRSTDEFEETRHAGTDPGPDDDAEKAQARRRLDRALSELPPEQRDAFLLYEEAGLSLADIAAVTGVGRETIKSRIRYANQKLRRALLDREDTV